MADILNSLSKYKIAEEKIHSDGISNVVSIERTYLLPKSLFFIPNKFAEDFYALDRKEFFVDGAKIMVSAIGWGDAKCSMFCMMLSVIPNGGEIIYSDKQAVR